MEDFEIATLRAEVKRLTAEAEHLQKRVRELEVRWDLEVVGGLRGELAELRGESRGRLRALEEEVARWHQRFLDAP